MPNLNYEPNSTESRFLKPKGGNGDINIVQDFAWTLSPKESRVQVPTMRLLEFQQNGGQLVASLLYYARLIGRGNESFLLGTEPNPSESYKFKYIADPTGWTYELPFFSKSHTNRSNSFGYADGQNPFHNLGKFGSEFLTLGGALGRKKNFLTAISSGVAGLQQGASFVEGIGNTMLPGKISLETPQSWDSTPEETISVQFHLFNTQSIEDVNNNRNFAHILRYNNSPSRRNFAIVDPPVIYSLHVPDIIHLPACFMSSLEITNLGNTQMMDIGDGKQRIIPEAYGFNMTFTSLLMPTRNILQSLDEGTPVEAISNIPGLNRFVTRYLKREYDSITRDFNSNPLAPTDFREQFDFNQERNRVISAVID